MLSLLRSLAVGPKGSYRVEHVLDFFEKHADPFTVERQTQTDWRLMYMDAFKPHMDESVASALWSKGYVPVLHGGGTTGIGQVNDTDCHGKFEQVYLDVEAQSLLHQQLLDPSDISRSRQQAASSKSFQTLHTLRFCMILSHSPFCYSTF